MQMNDTGPCKALRLVSHSSIIFALVTVILAFSRHALASSEACSECIGAHGCETREVVCQSNCAIRTDKSTCHAECSDARERCTLNAQQSCVPTCERPSAPVPGYGTGFVGIPAGPRAQSPSKPTPAKSAGSERGQQRSNDRCKRAGPAGCPPSVGVWRPGQRADKNLFFENRCNEDINLTVQWELDHTWTTATWKLSVSKQRTRLMLYGRPVVLDNPQFFFFAKSKSGEWLGRIKRDIDQISDQPNLSLREVGWFRHVSPDLGPDGNYTVTLHCS